MRGLRFHFLQTDSPWRLLSLSQAQHPKLKLFVLVPSQPLASGLDYGNSPATLGEARRSLKLFKAWRGMSR